MGIQIQKCNTFGRLYVTTDVNYDGVTVNAFWKMGIINEY